MLERLKQNKSQTDNDKKLNINIGVILQKQGQFKKAEEYLQKAVESTAASAPEDNFAANFNMGLNHMHQSHHDQALASFNACLLLLPSDSLSQSQL